MSKHPVIIGRFEQVDIVDKLDGIPAKIDTGAYRSSIHIKNVKVVEKDGKKVLRFTLLGHPISPESTVIEAPKYRELKVKNSTGHTALRYEVTLKIRLGVKVFNTSFTLSNRSNNTFPILIGRHALKGRFLVDVERAGVDRVQLKQALNLPLGEEDLEGVNT